MKARKPEIVGESKGDKRRRHLLEAATACFRKEGFHGTSMVRISRAARMSPGHIAHYFPTKESIVEAIAEQEENDIAELMRDMEKDQAQGDLKTRLTRQTAKMLAHNSAPDYITLALEILAEAARNPAVLKIARNSDNAMFRQFMELSKRIGFPAQMDEAELRLRVELIGAMFRGVMIRSLINPDLDHTLLAGLLNKVIETLLEKTVAA